MLERFKAFWQGVVLAPVVNLLLKLGVHPDLVTLVGTLGVAAGALAFYPRGELLVGTHPGRRGADELTVFKSLGLAVEDLAAAALCVERARERGLGTEVEF